MSGTITAAPGPYVVTFSADDHQHATPTTDTVTVTVTQEETLTAYTGVTGPVLDGSTVTLAGVLKEDGTTPLAGKSLTLTLGSGAAAQTCVATTDATGSASCPLVVNQPVGTQPVSAGFGGDTFYLPSSGASTREGVHGPVAEAGRARDGDRALSPAPNHQDGKELKELIAKLTEATSPVFWIDGNHVKPKHGDEVFDLEKGAVGELEELIYDKHTVIPDATLQPLIGILEHADQVLATVEIADATARRGQLAQARRCESRACRGRPRSRQEPLRGGDRRLPERLALRRGVDAQHLVRGSSAGNVELSTARSRVPKDVFATTVIVFVPVRDPRRLRRTFPPTGRARCCAVGPSPAAAVSTGRSTAMTSLKTS